MDDFNIDNQRWGTSEIPPCSHNPEFELSDGNLSIQKEDTLDSWQDHSLEFIQSESHQSSMHEFHAWKYKTPPASMHMCIGSNCKSMMKLSIMQSLELKVSKEF